MADNTVGEKELRTDYDEWGNIGKTINLVPEKSYVLQRDMVGL